MTHMMCVKDKTSTIMGFAWQFCNLCCKAIVTYKARACLDGMVPISHELYAAVSNAVMCVC